MNMLLVMGKTLTLARKYEMEKDIGIEASVSFEHLEAMFKQASSSEFSPAKLGRWLGWMQAAVLIHSVVNVEYHKYFILTLEDFKELNRSCSC